MRAEITRRARRIGCESADLHRLWWFRGETWRTVSPMRNRRDGYGACRRRQAEGDVTNLKLIAKTKFSADQSRQIGFPGYEMPRRQPEHVCIAKNQQAVMRFNRRMPQNEIVIFAAPDSDHASVIFQVDRAENGIMVNQLEHGCRVRAGGPGATRVLPSPRPGHISLEGPPHAPGRDTSGRGPDATAPS